MLPRVVNRLFSQDKKTDRILTQHVRMGWTSISIGATSQRADYRGSGAGKPWIRIAKHAQANSSFIVTDAKGEIIRSVGNLLVSEGYEIKI